MTASGEATGPVRGVEPLGSTPCRPTRLDGPAPEPALAGADRSAWEMSVAVVSDLVPGWDARQAATGQDWTECTRAEPGLDRVGSLLDLTDLDRFLRESLFALDGDRRSGWHPRISLEGTRLAPADHVHHDGFAADGRGARVNAYSLAAAMRAGASLYLRNATAHHLPLRRLLEHFRRVLGGSGHVGVFLSSGRASAPFGDHWDETENICFQLVGRRRWRVRVPSIPNNHYSLLSEDGEPGEVIFDAVLEPGQALVVPRAYWHEVTPVDDGLSLSATVGINRPVAHDALRWLLAPGAEDDALRRPLPNAGVGNGALRPVRDLVAAADDDAFAAYLQARELPLASGTPGLFDILDLAQPLDLVVRRQLTGQVALVDTVDGAIRVAGGGRVLTVADQFADVLAAALAGPPVAVADLVGAHAPDDVVKLVDQLLRLDWCVVAAIDEDPLARPSR